MHISERVRRLSPSLTLALVARTKELRASGRRILSLGAGEPDFRTPRTVCDAATRAMDNGHTRYTEVAGILELRQAVAGLYRERGVDVGPGNVIVGNGAKHALYNALVCLVDPGDEVIVPMPAWLSYPEMVKACDGVPVTLPCDESDGFRVDTVALERAITPRTRVLLLNPVSNPTGAVMSAEELRDIAEVCSRRGITVISDEIYERLVYAPASTVPYAASHASAAAHTVTISGVSKTFAMTGWRIGWAIAPDPLASAIRKFQGQSTSNASSISQYAALEALTGDQTVIHDMLEEFRVRRDRMVALLRAIPDVTVRRPDGAFYVFPRMDAYYGRRKGIDGSLALAEAMLEEVGVVVVPGLPFGSDAHIRLSYACSMQDIEEAIEKMSAFLAGL
jgi:aspartate aminotransferase